MIEGVFKSGGDPKGAFSFVVPVCLANAAARQGGKNLS